MEMVRGQPRFAGTNHSNAAAPSLRIHSLGFLDPPHALWRKCAICRYAKGICRFPEGAYLHLPSLEEFAALQVAVLLSFELCVLENRSGFQVRD
jgi:hypothetical protein